MAKLLLRCPQCGEEEITDTPCPYTGWQYSEGWVVKCPRCNSSMTARPDEPVVKGRHVSECEKVLIGHNQHIRNIKE